MPAVSVHISFLGYTHFGSSPKTDDQVTCSNLACDGKVVLNKAPIRLLILGLAISAVNPLCGAVH